MENKSNTQILKKLSTMMLNSEIDDFTLEVKEKLINTPGNAVLSKHEGFIKIMGNDNNRVITDEAFDNHYRIEKVIVESHEPVTRGNQVGVHRVTDVYIFE